MSRRSLFSALVGEPAMIFDGAVFPFATPLAWVWAERTTEPLALIGANPLDWRFAINISAGAHFDPPLFGIWMAMSETAQSRRLFGGARP